MQFTGFLEAPSKEALDKAWQEKCHPDWNSLQMQLWLPLGNFSRVENQPQLLEKSLNQCWRHVKQNEHKNTGMDSKVPRWSHLVEIPSQTMFENVRELGVESQHQTWCCKVGTSMIPIAWNLACKSETKCKTDKKSCFFLTVFPVPIDKALFWPQQ